MKQKDIIPQTDGCTRYLFSSPRGDVAVDCYRDGTRITQTCLGWRGTKQERNRDLRDARRMQSGFFADDID